jgi:hypothetical protein
VISIAASLSIKRNRWYINSIDHICDWYYWLCIIDGLITSIVLIVFYRYYWSYIIDILIIYYWSILIDILLIIYRSCINFFVQQSCRLVRYLMMKLLWNFYLSLLLWNLEFQHGTFILSWLIRKWFGNVKASIMCHYFTLRRLHHVQILLINFSTVRAYGWLIG